VTRERGRAHGPLGEPQAEEGRPSRERLPAWQGTASLAHEPGAKKGPKASGVLQGLGGGQGTPNAPETGYGQSERSIVPQAGSGALLAGQVGHRCPRAPREGRRRRASRFLGGPRGETPGSPTVSMPLQSIAHQAKRYPAMVCNTVLHWMDRACLLAASRQTRQSRAPGVDQRTAQQYAEPLDDNLRDLPARRRDHRYVAPPVARVWIAKDAGTQRPIGQPCFEDKMVQRAVGRMLEASFEPELQAVSPGCSKGHRQPQALHERREQCRTWPMAWSVEADGSGFCDHLAWGPLRECIQPRVRDGGLWRLLGKGLHAGGLESGALRSPDKGTPPGGVLAPMGSNVCLHRVLDGGCVKDVQPRRQGRCFLPRCADDCLSGCALAAAARRGRAVLPQRVARLRLTMPPETTAFMACKRPPSREPWARGTGGFDLLGLPHYGATTRRGDWVLTRQTVGKRLRRLRRALWTWGRENRQAPWHAQSQTLGLTRRGSDPY